MSQLIKELVEIIKNENNITPFLNKLTDVDKKIIALYIKKRKDSHEKLTDNQHLILNKVADICVQKKVIPDETRKLFFGDYSAPKILEDIYSFQDGGLTNYGFRVDFFYSEYNPLDVIPFATTEIESKYFGFLTDFGRITDLEKAPIVIVDPGALHVNIVSSNLSEFLRILATLKEGYNLLGLPDQNYKINTGNTSILGLVKEFELEEFTLEEVKSLIQKAKDDRIKSININDAFGIGICYDFKDKIDKRLTEIEDYDKVYSFLEHSNKSERIVFYRNCIQFYIWEEDDEFIETIANYLKNDGFLREALVLENLNPF